MGPECNQAKQARASLVKERSVRVLSAIVSNFRAAEALVRTELLVQSPTLSTTLTGVSFITHNNLFTRILLDFALGS